MKTKYLEINKMPIDLPIWECLDPANNMLSAVKSGAFKNQKNKCIDFTETAGRQSLFGYGPDLIEMSRIQFSADDICSIVVKIKINDDINTPDIARVFGFDTHYWRFDDDWQSISPQTTSVKKKSYTAGTLRKMATDEYGFITLVHVVNMSELVDGAWNYNPATASAVAPNMRFSRIPAEPNSTNNITFSLYYIAVYNEDVSYLQSSAKDSVTSDPFVGDSLLTHKEEDSSQYSNRKTIQPAANLKVIVNIDNEPLIKTYPYYLFIFSVIGKEHPSYDNWVLSEMTLLRYQNGFGLDRAEPYKLKLLDTIEIDDDTINSENLFHNCIIEHLQKGYTAVIELEEFYIPGREAYNDYKRSHNNMIFGYDYEKNIYLMTGYDDGFVKVIEVSTQNLYKAFTEKTRYVPTYFIKKNLNHYPIDWWGLSRDLKSYYEGINIGDLYWEPGISDIGINAMEKFILLIEGIKNSGHRIDLKITSTLYEHKLLLLYKYKVLLQNGVTFKQKDIEEKLEENAQDARICFNLLMKYRITAKTSDLCKIQENVRKIIEVEKYIIPILIDGVDKHKRKIINLELI